MAPLLKLGYDRNTALLFLKLCSVEDAIWNLVEADDTDERILPGDEWKLNDGSESPNSS